MMKAVKNFMNKPITWGAYFKICGVAMGLYGAIFGAYIAYEKWMNHKFEQERLKKMQESNRKDYEF